MSFSLRQKKLLSLFARQNFYTLSQIAERLDISLSTARRDLDSLQRSRIVKRTHGGAVLIRDTSELPYVFSDRKSRMEKEKAAIGRIAAGLIEEGDTIIIDGGTTPYQVAVHLQNRKNLQIVTNSLPVLSLLSGKKDIQLICTGGVFHQNTGVFLGSYAVDILKGIHVQKAFIGVAGINETGFYNSNPLVVETEKQMIESASEAYIVADHTKFGKKALADICDLKFVRAIITDLLVQDKQPLIDLIRKQSVQIITR